MSSALIWSEKSKSFAISHCQRRFTELLRPMLTPSRMLSLEMAVQDEGYLLETSLQGKKVTGLKGRKVIGFKDNKIGIKDNRIGLKDNRIGLKDHRISHRP